MKTHRTYSDQIEAKHVSLQVSLSDWIKKEHPVLAQKLDAFPIPNFKHNCLTLDAITMRMASAALEVLLVSVHATGLELESYYANQAEQVSQGDRMMQWQPIETAPPG